MNLQGPAAAASDALDAILPRVEPKTIAGTLDRLAQADVTVEEAKRLIGRMKGQELDALPLVFRRLHDAHEPAQVHAAALVLRSWSDLPLAAALPPALRTLIAERSVADLNRLAAAALLEAFDDPMDDAELAGLLDDPAALKRAALSTAVQTLGDPFAAMNTLEALAQFPTQDVLRTIDDLARLGDPTAVSLLVPLAHAAEVDIAISAVAALDTLLSRSALTTSNGGDDHETQDAPTAQSSVGVPEAREGLHAVAEAHPDPSVRHEAGVTRARLATKAGVSKAFHSLPPVEVWIGDVETGAVLLIARRSAIDPSLYAALTIRTTTEEGIIEYAAVERLPSGPEPVKAAFEESGTQLRVIDPLRAHEHLEASTELTLETGAGKGYAWAAWRAVLGRAE